MSRRAPYFVHEPLGLTGSGSPSTKSCTNDSPAARAATPARHFMHEPIVRGWAATRARHFVHELIVRRSAATRARYFVHEPMPFG